MLPMASWHNVISSSVQGKSLGDTNMQECNFLLTCGEFALNMTLDLKLNTDIHELLNFSHLISANKTNLHQN
jgi:hypothetical protein